MVDWKLEFIVIPSICTYSKKGAQSFCRSPRAICPTLEHCFQSRHVAINSTSNLVFPMLSILFLIPPFFAWSPSTFRVLYLPDLVPSGSCTSLLGSGQHALGRDEEPVPMGGKRNDVLLPEFVFLFLFSFSFSVPLSRS